MPSRSPPRTRRLRRPSRVCTRNKPSGCVIWTPWTLDFIVCTVPFPHDATPYAKLLKPGGKLSMVGALFRMDVDFNDLIRTGKRISTWNTGGTALVKEYLQWTSPGQDVLSSWCPFVT